MYRETGNKYTTTNDLDQALSMGHNNNNISIVAVMIVRDIVCQAPIATTPSDAPVENQIGVQLCQGIQDFVESTKDAINEAASPYSYAFAQALSLLLCCMFQPNNNNNNNVSLTATTTITMQPSATMRHSVVLTTEHQLTLARWQ
jgi:hypothetical protein